MARRGRLSHLKKDLERKPGAPSSPPPEGPAIRKTDKSTTPGGLLRRTVYFSEDEWSALLTASFRSGRSVSDLLRELTRERFRLDDPGGFGPT